ncbi:hypothetical protein BP5796_05559 [Coleophoma crateriformis]|uniref:Cytochrome P450 n=1 Tax=Coleophoma crateriformis TaxID=565419 RepID=A0A3D8S442_9HELO|nr:hypothetical protein BP5796_05559 [Coleophoma crateriformis]
MPLMSFFPSWYTVACLAMVPIAVLLSDAWKWLRMPPGPTPLPFIGNKFQLPQHKPWIKFQEWSHAYGPVFTLWVGRRPTLVISDPLVAVELMEKRSHKYSSRPRFVVMGEILNNMASILVQPYGKEWSLRRKLLHRALTPAALRSYMARQEAEASRLVLQIMSNPVEWERAFERFTSSVVFSVAYGHRIDSLDAAVIQDRMRFMHYQASLNVPGAYLAESIPILKYLPRFMAPWKRDVEDHGKLEVAANMALVQDVIRDLDQGTEKGIEVAQSLTRTLLETRAKEGIALSDKDFSFVPASLFGAGSDTTASTLCTAVLALVTNTPILRAAQAELDTVIGSARTPQFSDEPQLPYVRALVKEVLRWRPVAVLGGTPHASTEDDVYEGFHIPSGTTILGNSWAINLNPTYYPSPQTFDPARFLSATDPGVRRDLQGSPHPSKTGHSSFGWGRRICPGADLATNALFIALAKLLWSFDILPLPGRVYDTFDYTDGFNIRPKPFPCQIVLRSETHRLVLEREMLAAEHEMAKFPAYN